MTTLGQWLQRQDTEKILLVEIDPAGPSPIYLADTPYYTEPTDALPNQPYTPAIADGGVPRLARRIQEVWGGRSVPTWGPLVLATPDIDGVDLSAVDIRGKTIRVLLTGPRKDINWSESAVVLEGNVGHRSGNPDEGITIEVLDRQALFSEIEIPTATYDGTETANFPSNNIGRTKPWSLGRNRNVQGVLVDSLNLIWQVNDGHISDVFGAKDNGIALSKVTGTPVPGEYSVNYGAGTVQLGGKPVGEPTFDVDGILDGVTWLSGTAQIIDWLARVHGNMLPGSIDIVGLPIETVGIHLLETTRLDEVITRLMQGVLGWWGFTRQDVLRVRLFSAPQPGGPTFDETQQLADIEWEEEAELIWAVPLLYRRNWTRIEKPASTVDVDTTAWLASEGNETRIEDATIKTNYSYAIPSRRVETYFDDVGPAQTVGNRALALFGVPRRRTRATTPFTDPPLELGASIELTDTDQVDGDHVIVGIVDRWDGEIPLLEMEVWG